MSSSTPDSTPALYGQAAGVNVKALWALPAAVACSPAGVVLAHLARHEIRRTGERGRGLTLAALVIGYSTTVLWLVCCVSMVASVPFTS